MRADTEVRWVPVREAGDVRMGKQLSPTSRNAAGQFPYLRVANVHLGRIDYADVNTMSFSGRERETYGLKPGDILLNEGQSLELVGRSAIYEGADGEYYFQNTLVRFRPNGQVLSAYAQVIFERWLARGVFAAIAKQTTSIAHLGGERFAALEFPLLPLADQGRIVAVIDAVTAQERAIEASIAKLRSVRAGLLLSTASSMAGGADVGDGVDALGNVLLGIEAGRSPDLPDVPAAVGGWGVLKVSAVHVDGFRPRENKMMLSGMVNARYQVHPGDLIISRANTPELVGSACIVTESDFRLLLSDKTLRLVVNPKMADVRYVNACLSMPNVRAQIVNSASGSSLSMQNVNQRSIERLIIPKLNLSEQIKFADRIDSCDALIGEERRKLAKLRAVKRGLVDDLLASGGADQRSGL